MLTDKVLGLWNSAGGWLADTLPDGATATIPGATEISGLIGKADSLLPVSGLLQVAAGVLACVLGFLALRLLLLVRYVLLP